MPTCTWHGLATLRSIQEAHPLRVTGHGRSSSFSVTSSHSRHADQLGPCTEQRSQVQAAAQRGASTGGSCNGQAQRFAAGEATRQQAHRTAGRQEAQPLCLGNGEEAQHWDRNVERLSELVSKQSVQQWEQWKEQEIANALYSWAVLTAAHAATPSPGLKNMAQRLFNRAAIRRESYFVKAHFSQLYMAHQVAVRVGLPGGGLSADQVLMRACARSYEASLLELRNKIRRTASMEQEVAAALQHAGYDVDRSIIVGSKFMQLQAQGVAVTVVAAKDFFCAPLGLLRGRIAVHNVMASWVCKGCMVISEAEWADLVGDPQRQQAFVSQRLEQALSKA
ncbi:hypothetical protein DUNSADRAFT_10511 [Dunaliella salina]|uniref:RAP domain-containing protein n=1 Tax=Dunaliella salina TaxID=3046 RepID=A0ABQ7GF45_DUNSA|nr:hypothetical protein DUNSADRAFT_10511 [Dunaliella salina]|eukprot:KAF5833229.1 hypothetical protein DUNSADRAFT_10511 [Dunaliella salina]